MPDDDKPEFTWRVTNRDRKAEIEIGDWPAPPGPVIANLDEIRANAIGQALIKLGTRLVQVREDDFENEDF